MKQSPPRKRDYDFGQAMFSLRSAIGLTQAVLADFLHVSRKAVGDWEAGNSYPKASHFKQLITLAVQNHAFPAGQEDQSIRTLWHKAHTRVFIDEQWLATLLQPAAHAQISGRSGTRFEDEPLSPEPQSQAYGLPFQITSFIGRTDELAAIKSTLHDRVCRLLTLLGPGGIGKTRLAIELASSQKEAFPNGTAFVALASVNTTNQIISAIGDTLNLSLADQADSRSSLLGALRDRNLLLVLDNFEHLMDSVDLVHDILEHALGITIVVTSRVRLQLRKEWLFDVDGLAFPGGNSHSFTTNQEMMSYSAIQLFVERARQVQPKIMLNDLFAATVIKICQHVAGIPLAIELAAASMRMLPLVDIERQIRSNLNFLTTNFRDVPLRHRSLRAVFDHSWQLLSEPDQQLLSRLTVFRGGYTFEAARQIAGANLSTLTSLIDNSLVRVVHPPNAPGAGRFSLLEPVREYALEKLTERGEVDAIRQAHATYYLQMVESANSAWHTTTSDRAIARIGQEQDNLRAAMQWARDGGDPILGLQLAGMLIRFWRNRGNISEGRTWFAELLALAVENTEASIAARSRALHGAAWLAADQHDFAQAQHLFEQQTALDEGLEQAEGAVNLMTNAAIKARAEGEYARATELFEGAVARHRAQGNRGTLASGGLGFSLYFLALVQRERGDFTHAIELFKECEALHRSLGERTGVAQSLLGLSDVARDQGDAALNRRYSEESLTIYREFGTQWAIAFALNNQAQAAAIEGDLTQALTLVNESLDIFRTQKAEASMAEVLVTQGHILRAQAKVDAAYTAFSHALRIAQNIGPRLLIASALEGLTFILVQKGRLEYAVRLFASVSALRQHMGVPIRPADRPDVDQALAHAQQVLGAETFTALWSEGYHQLPGQILTETA